MKETENYVAQVIRNVVKDVPAHSQNLSIRPLLFSYATNKKNKIKVGKSLDKFFTNMNLKDIMNRIEVLVANRKEITGNNVAAVLSKQIIIAVSHEFDFPPGHVKHHHHKETSGDSSDD